MAPAASPAATRPGGRVAGGRLQPCSERIGTAEMLSTDDRRRILGTWHRRRSSLRSAAWPLRGVLPTLLPATAIAAACPLEIRLSRWGDEFYGDCGVVAGAAPDAREVMEIGEVAYWPPGRALCVFFGPHPCQLRYGAARSLAREPRGHPRRKERRPGGGAVLTAGERPRPDDRGIGAESYPPTIPASKRRRTV